MSKKTLILITILLLLTTLLFTVATSQNKKTQEQKFVAPKTPEKTVESVRKTDLFLSPDSLVLSSNSGSINVDLSTEENNVTAIQLEMSYDPKVLGGITLSPGTFFEDTETLIENIDEKNGRISYALILPPNSPAKKGKGTVAVINFKVLNRKVDTTTISFLPKTLVTAEGVNPSVLRRSTGATIIFSQQ